MTEVAKIESSLVVCLGGKQFTPCSTFAECSQTIQNFINNNFLGSTEYCKKKNIGHIYHPIKGKFAEVSYNGRVWEREGKEIIDLNTSDI